MTRIITRYFESADAARMVKAELVRVQRFSPRILSLYENSDGLAETLTAAQVDGAAATAYASKLSSGGAVLLVRAGSKPLNVAKIARTTMDAMGAGDMGGVTEEVYVKDPVGPSPSVFTDHRHILYKERDPDSTDYFMADWPIPHISRRKPSDKFAFPRHARMAAFPIPLLDDRKPFDKSIFPRHARMANFPIGLISKRKPYTGTIFPRHARMANFPIPLISRRKPYTGSIIARHARMANWPFPHLMSSPKHTNSLMPGAPRMANFPIGLISRRKPNTASIFPRHARMANFPLPLISRRKPNTASIFPRHARMADAILPLISKDFSVSKMLGLKTISRR